MNKLRTKKSTDPTGLVADGSRRLARHVRATITDAVTAEFSARMVKANWLQRFRLRREIRQEIKRRMQGELDQQMPSNETLW